MEVDVGDQCTFPQCKRLDFLPFTCDYCEQVFCKDHRIPSAHDCEHINTNSVSTPPERQKFLFGCSLPSCKKRDVTAVECQLCEQSYCIQHRHPQDHSCPSVATQPQQPLTVKTRKGGKMESTAKAAVTSGVKGGRSSKHTSAKVALMRLKMRAVGLDSIPQEERVYFEIQLPKGSKLPNTPMFLSKEWSVGRTVDYIAQRFKLKNNNHKPQAKKLQLHSDDGGLLSMSNRLGTLIETVVAMGTTLRLEYDE